MVRDVLQAQPFHARKWWFFTPPWAGGSAKISNPIKKTPKTYQVGIYWVDLSPFKGLQQRVETA